MGQANSRRQSSQVLRSPSLATPIPAVPDPSSVTSPLSSPVDAGQAGPLNPGTAPFHDSDIDISSSPLSEPESSTAFPTHVPAPLAIHDKSPTTPTATRSPGVISKRDAIKRRFSTLLSDRRRNKSSASVPSGGASPLPSTNTPNLRYRRSWAPISPAAEPAPSVGASTSGASTSRRPLSSVARNFLRDRRSSWVPNANARTSQHLAESSSTAIPALAPEEDHQGEKLGPGDSSYRQVDEEVVEPHSGQSFRRQPFDITPPSTPVPGPLSSSSHPTFEIPAQPELESSTTAPSASTPSTSDPLAEERIAAARTIIQTLQSDMDHMRRVIERLGDDLGEGSDDPSNVNISAGGVDRVADSVAEIRRRTMALAASTREIADATLSAVTTERDRIREHDAALGGEPSRGFTENSEHDAPPPAAPVSPSPSLVEVEDALRRAGALAASTRAMANATLSAVAAERSRRGDASTGYPNLSPAAPVLPLGPPRMPVVTSGTTMIVQGVVQTADLSRIRRDSPSVGTDGTRAVNPGSIDTNASPSVTESTTPPGSPTRLENDTMGDGEGRTPQQDDGIDMLAMLLSVVTAATGASLMNGSTTPDFSAIPNLVGQANGGLQPGSTATASTGPSSSNGPSGMLDSATPVASTSTLRPAEASTSALPAPLTLPAPNNRPRRLLHSVRSRLFGGNQSRSSSPLRPPPTPSAPGPSDTPISSGGPTSSVEPGDPADRHMEQLRASIAQELTRALARHVNERASTASRSATRAATPGSSTPATDGEVRVPHARADPVQIPLPPSRSASLFSSSDRSPPPAQENTAIGEEGSFERFLHDIQVDLRETLITRQEQDRARASMERRGEAGASVDVPPDVSAPAPVEEAFVPNQHLRPHVPTVDLPLNWWRMYRFPPRNTVPSIPNSPTTSTSPTEVASASTAASSSTAPLFPGSVPSASATAPPAAAGGLVPVIVVGLRQQRPPEVEVFGGPAAFTHPDREHAPDSDDASTSSDEETDTIATSTNPISDTEDFDLERLRALARSRPRPTTDYVAEVERVHGPNWREHARAFISGALARGDAERERERQREVRRREQERRRRRRREAAAAAAEAEAAAGRQARGEATRSYVIWVIGGFYPAHMLLAPNVLLGQFDHDDFWALAEFLGQVKPPVATQEDIEQSGLQVIKTAQLAEYAEQEKISSNTVDRCAICLADYEPEEDIRILSCRHGFHKDCVDQWFTTGRNNCPACRTKGVSVGETTPTPAASAAS